MSDPEPPVTREVILQAHLEPAKPTDRIEIRRIRIAPGHAAGLHVHNGPVVGSILEGEAIYQIEGQPESVLRPGEVFFEPEGARIARFDAGPEGVTFLGYFLLAAGEEAEIAFPDN
ncbi:MAG TPA: cupin domain-containing protein [Mycobacteriales bacterium]|nr:cupin domain-containing protein [Mycobacteriales bacterium]